MTHEELYALALAAIDDAPMRACWLCGDAEDGPRDPCGGGVRHEYVDVPPSAAAVDARVVLEDAMREYFVGRTSRRPLERADWTMGRRNRTTLVDGFFADEGVPATTAARALAAALLCADWCDPTVLKDHEERRWFPYAERSRRPAGTRMGMVGTPWRELPPRLELTLDMDLPARSVSVNPVDEPTRAWMIENAAGLGDVTRTLHDRVARTAMNAQTLVPLAFELTAMLRRRWPEREISVRALPPRF